MPLRSRFRADRSHGLASLNAFAERWVRSIKCECLSKLILFGEASLRRSTRSTMKLRGRDRILPASPHSALHSNVSSGFMRRCERRRTASQVECATVDAGLLLLNTARIMSMQWRASCWPIRNQGIRCDERSTFSKVWVSFRNFAQERRRQRKAASHPMCVSQSPESPSANAHSRR